MAVLELDKDNLDEHMHYKDLIVVFSSKTCGACKRIRPHLWELDEKYQVIILDVTRVEFTWLSFIKQDASIILTTEPLFAAAASAILVGETFGFSDVIEAAFIVGACITAVRMGESIESLWWGDKEMLCGRYLRAGNDLLLLSQVCYCYSYKPLG